jgi:hypothetical protein
MTPFHPTKNLIYAVTKDVELIKRCMAGVKLVDPDEYWSAVLRRVEEAVKPRKKARKRVELSDAAKARYRQAKWDYESVKFKPWVQDGHFIEPEYACTTANELTDFVMNYIKWMGGRATRVSSAGRMVDGKFIPSTTRRGTADISATIKGRSVMFEVKAGADKPSPAQIKEQAKERAAGGEYFFTHNVDEFFRQYDSICVVKTLF